MHHSSKTDPRRSLRHTPPTARTPQRTARITRSGDVVRDDIQEEQASAVAAPESQTRPARKPRPARAASVRQRLRRKSRKLGRGHVVLLSVSGMLCLVLLAMISIVHADYRWMKGQADTKAELLAVLREQHRVGQRRLAVLKSGAGREQLLLEHGYIRPGDRILLFPATKEDRRAAQIPKNDLAPHPPSMSENPDGKSTPSAWRRAGAVLGGWWDTLQKAAGLKPDKAQRPARE